MTKNSYHYPDTDDRITQYFIEHEEPFVGYWVTSEERTLARASMKLSEVLGPKADVRALDAGCGDGRLLGWIAQFSSQITAVDPDLDRLSAARRRWTSINHDAKVMFELAPVQDYDKGEYDLIVCSHVIQHVETRAMDEILRKLRCLAAPACVLVLTYSRAAIGGQHYSINFLHQDRVHSKKVSQEKFDDAIRTDDVQRVLPIAHLDPVVLREQLKQLGWSEFWNWAYHILDDLGVLDAYADRDLVANGCRPLTNRLGRDMLTLSHCGSI